MTEAAESSDPLLGLVLGGKYRILSELGRGGMGVVYRAQHEQLDSDCALKILSLEYAADDQGRERLLREARAAAKVRHPNVVRVYDVGDDGPDGRPYLVMELLSGESLKDYLQRRGKLDVVESAQIGLAVAQGLAKAHELGIVHRDLKPENVFLHDEGARRVPKVLDFGIAKVQDAAGPKTGAHLWYGTVGYTAPYGSSAVDPRLDQFSLGVLLHECLTGENPFISRSEAALDYPKYVARVAKADSRFRVLEDTPGVPPAIVSAIRRALSLNAEDRFASLTELERVLEGLLPAGRSDAPRAPKPGSVHSEPPVDPLASTVAASSSGVRAIQGQDAADTLPAQPEPERRRRPGFLLLLGLVAVVAVGAWQLGRPKAPPVPDRPSVSAAARPAAPPAPAVPQAAVPEPPARETPALTESAEPSAASVRMPEPPPPRNRNPSPRKSTQKVDEPAPTAPSPSASGRNMKDRLDKLLERRLRSPQ